MTSGEDGCALAILVRGYRGATEEDLRRDDGIGAVIRRLEVGRELERGVVFAKEYKGEIIGRVVKSDVGLNAGVDVGMGVFWTVGVASGGSAFNVVRVFFGFVVGSAVTSRFVGTVVSSLDPKPNSFWPSNEVFTGLFLSSSGLSLPRYRCFHCSGGI
jgi:hypothetical protein